MRAQDAEDRGAARTTTAQISEMQFPASRRKSCGDERRGVASSDVDRRERAHRLRLVEEIVSCVA
jgi:hypothetical protein